jgi:hypothetical protein
MRRSSTPSPSGSSHCCANYSASARMLQRPRSWRPGTAVTDFAPKLPSQCCAAPRRFRPPPAWCSVTGSIAAATVKPTQRYTTPSSSGCDMTRPPRPTSQRKAEGKSKREIFRCLKRYVARRSRGPWSASARRSFEAPHEGLKLPLDIYRRIKTSRGPGFEPGASRSRTAIVWVSLCIPAAPPVPS